MRLIWEHRMSLERGKGSEAFLQDYILSWMQQGYRITRTDEEKWVHVTARIETEVGGD